MVCLTTQAFRMPFSIAFTMSRLLATVLYTVHALVSPTYACERRHDRCALVSERETATTYGFGRVLLVPAFAATVSAATTYGFGRAPLMPAFAATVSAPTTCDFFFAGFSIGSGGTIPGGGAGGGAGVGAGPGGATDTSGATAAAAAAAAAATAAGEGNRNGPTAVGATAAASAWYVSGSGSAPGTAGGDAAVSAAERICARSRERIYTRRAKRRATACPQRPPRLHAAPSR